MARLEMFARLEEYSGDDDDGYDAVEVPRESVPPPGTLVSQRPKLADYVTDLSYQVETEDREDHTFFGMMFDLEAKSEVPIEHVVLTEIMVRGDLGHVTVWWTPGSFHAVKTKKEMWTCVYDAAHAPSFDEYTALAIHPVTLAPGSTIGLYIHCRHHSDTALVYDNRRNEVVHEDSFIQVHAGMAHLDNIPFGDRNPWGFGHGPDCAFRANRTFVGRLQLGAKYKLWNPERELHAQFPRAFREMVKTFLLVARRPESNLPFDDMTLYYIFNMCRYDWFDLPVLTPAASSRRQFMPNLQQLRRWSGYNHVYEPPVRRQAVEDDSADAVEPDEVSRGVVLRRAAVMYNDSDDDDSDLGDYRPTGQIAHGAIEGDIYSDSDSAEFDASVEDSSDDDAVDSADSDDAQPEAPQSPERPKRAGGDAGSPTKTRRAR
jgi:hypothetical protein